MPHHPSPGVTSGGERRGSSCVLRGRTGGRGALAVRGGRLRVPAPGMPELRACGLLRLERVASRTRRHPVTGRPLPAGETSLKVALANWPTPTEGEHNRRELHAPGPDTRRPPLGAGLRGLPEDRGHVGTPARMPLLRARRLLRLEQEQARNQALPGKRPPDRAILPARGGLDLVLRGRGRHGARPLKSLRGPACGLGERS